LTSYEMDRIEIVRIWSRLKISNPFTIKPKIKRLSLEPIALLKCQFKKMNRDKVICHCIESTILLIFTLNQNC
jgi:hypothetical protein